jgi:hypothetical protein
LKTKSSIIKTTNPNTLAGRFRTASAARLLPLLLLIPVPVLTVKADQYGDFTYSTDGANATITGYTGSGGDVTIPDKINDLLVTGIGYRAFFNCNLTSVTIGTNVTSIGGQAFLNCSSLTSVAIPNSVTSIGSYAFQSCSSLTNVAIPDSVTNIGIYGFVGCIRLMAITVDVLNPAYSSVDGILFDKSQTTIIRYLGGKPGSYTIPNTVANIGSGAFESCYSLTSVTIPNSVTSIGANAFYYCTSLTGIYFQGNAPSVGFAAFISANNATAYYLPGTMGWGPMFGGPPSLPTALWLLPYPLILNNNPEFGVQTNGFGFIISWATNISVVVEACADLANPTWTPVGTNTLTGGSCYFSDPDWTNYPGRFYRLRSP